MEIEDIIAVLCFVGIASVIGFAYGKVSGSEDVCSQFKEHVLTIDGKCIKVEQDQPKEK